MVPYAMQERILWHWTITYIFELFRIGEHVRVGHGPEERQPHTPDINLAMCESVHTHIHINTYTHTHTIHTHTPRMYTLSAPF